jgi:hypothetical protein
MEPLSCDYWQFVQGRLYAARVMTRDVTFPETTVEALRNAKILGVRAGSEHRYTGVWVVVVEGRVFVRSWNDKPTGWFRAFKNQPSGTIQVADLEIPVTGKSVRSARLRDAVTAAFGEKYPTKGSKKWVEGFAEPSRVNTTLEFVPG